MPEIDQPPRLWADENEELTDKTKKPRSCWCESCGDSAAVYAKTVDYSSHYDWLCASCGYTPESVEVKA